eukprot:3718618-Rhodomonas_salina.1
MLAQGDARLGLAGARRRGQGGERSGGVEGEAGGRVCVVLVVDMLAALGVDQERGGAAQERHALVWRTEQDVLAERAWHRHQGEQLGGERGGGGEGGRERERERAIENQSKRARKNEKERERARKGEKEGASRGSDGGEGEVNSPHRHERAAPLLQRQRLQLHLLPHKGPAQLARRRTEHSSAEPRRLRSRSALLCSP